MLYKNIILHAGLTDAQAEILDYLIENGENKASVIAKKIKKPRGSVYKTLEELIEVGLAEKFDKDDFVSLFRAEHPQRLESFFKLKEKEAQREKTRFYNTLPEMISTYNISNNKPGMRFYEGEKGFKNILYNSLKSKTEIRIMIDINSILDKIDSLYKEYLDELIKREKNVKMLVADTKEAREYFKDKKSKFIETRFINKNFCSQNSGIQIYRNKISYQIIHKDKLLSILIEDKNISKMQELNYQYIWESLNKQKS